MGFLKNNFECFYRLITEIETLKDKTLEVEEVYNDLTTILINITSEDFINFSGEMQ
jgi:hypothetical protein